MLKKINYFWRLMGTALCFTLFGMGGLFIGTSIWLMSHLNIFPKEQYSPKARLLISKAFFLYINFMRIIGLLSYEIHGQEKLNLPGKKLVIANHPSLLDVVFLISMIPQANCIVKSALWNNFFTRPPVKAASYISNESDTLIEEGVHSLNSGETLVVFPEGTRTVPDRPIKLFRGAANIAILSNTPPIPVLIDCQPRTLLKKQNWYNIPPEAPHFTLTVLEPLDIKAHLNNNKSQSANARALTKEIKVLFEQLTHNDSDSPEPASLETPNPG